MKKIGYFIGLGLLIVLTGCAASGTQSQLSSVRNPMNNVSTTIRLTNQQVRIMKNTQQYPNALQKPEQ